MERFAPLDRLPAGLIFPHRFDGKIGYDPGRRALAFRGFMSKADYDELFRLCGDWPYRRALEELFRACDADDGPPRRRGLRRLLESVAGLV